MNAQTYMDDKYKEAGRVINSAGGSVLPVNDTLVKLLRYYIREDELDFILAFRDSISQTLDQLKESTQLPEQEILDKVNALASRGVIFNQPNRKGVMVYRLLPLMNVGTFEYTFMVKVENNESNRRISALFDQLFQEYREMVQENYGEVGTNQLQDLPVDRTVPITEKKSTGDRIRIVVDESPGEAADQSLPTQEVGKLIEKFDDIALGHCFCRHYKDLSDQPCPQTDLRETCFSFGKSARYTTEHGFSRMVSKEEALDVLKKAEADGLVHKAFHPNSDINRDETSICNCCRCCCVNSVQNIIVPINNATNFLADFDPDLCSGCGTCVEYCHTGAATLLEDREIAQRDPDLCIGCGVCASLCPENAISLLEGRTRIIRVNPKGKNS